ncbi:DUF3379 family protein [Thiomicrorhabdus sp.]|uniref:DUF3379 family protein n=1 Tax=Thiomicrorhabdus sp. TaxID=2039724 RepID=UPI0029C9785B|nr:DUF3379 family protein [Thiomicrorhabdus sp.]
MNELKFRQKLLSDPNSLDEDMLAFLARHPEQAQSVKRARQFDQILEEIFDVEPPEGLKERILLKNSYERVEEEKVAEDSEVAESSTNSGGSAAIPAPKRVTVIPAPDTESKLVSSWFRMPSLMAASVFALALLFSGSWYYSYQNRTLDGQDYIAHIIKHIEADPELMTAYKVPETPHEMQSLFAKVGAQLQKPIESMSYAGECDVEGQKGLHIVMQDKEGPVTIIVMPGNRLTAMEAFQASGYHGELIPVKGGVVAIVANSMEQIALAQMRFFQAVRFV